MDRPSMNPLFMDGLKPPSKKRSYFKLVFSLIASLFRFLLADVRFWRSGKLRNEDGNAFWRLVRGLGYRVAMLPLPALVVIGSLVYLATHPQRPATTLDPQSVGVYFENIEFRSLDSTPLDAWYVPVLDPKRVAEKRDKIFSETHPAVVLVHDQGEGRMQMLSLVRPLHDAGFVVLVPTLRGTEGSYAGSTFGLRESDDVQAAIDLLRRRAGIDPRRIAVLGVGTGAHAAVIAASRDTNIAALVLDRPLGDPEKRVVSTISPRQPYLRHLQPVCRWIFEAAYRVDVDDLELERYGRVLEARPVFSYTEAAGNSALRVETQKELSGFLRRHLADKDATATTDTK